MADIVKIFIGNSIEVQHLASILEENNIAVLVKDNHQSGIIAGFGMPTNSVELFVSPKDEDEALKILSAMESGVE